jgi:hypothetical protein
VVAHADIASPADGDEVLYICFSSLALGYIVPALKVECIDDIGTPYHLALPIKDAPHVL